jgi:hypothetical protein
MTLQQEQHVINVIKPQTASKIAPTILAYRSFAFDSNDSF